jgi:hypothetical protein
MHRGFTVYDLKPIVKFRHREEVNIKMDLSKTASQSMDTEGRVARS